MSLSVLYSFHYKRKKKKMLSLLVRGKVRKRYTLRLKHESDTVQFYTHIEKNVTRNGNRILPNDAFGTYIEEKMQIICRKVLVQGMQWVIECIRTNTQPEWHRSRSTHCLLLFCCCCCPLSSLVSSSFFFSKEETTTPGNKETI